MNLLPSIIRRPLARWALSATENERAPTDDFWYSKPGITALTGLQVTPQLALQVSAFFACVKVISETLAMLPLIVYERTGETSRKRAIDEPTYRLLHKQPNSWQTPYDFKETLTAWAATHGNGYALKVFGRDGVVKALIPVHPTTVRLELVAVDGKINDRLYDPDRMLSRLDDGEDIQLRYMVKQANGQEKPFVSGEMLHVRGISFDAVGGVVISRHAREAISLAQAMEAFGSRYFANDLTMGTVIEHPKQLGDKAYARLQDGLAQRSGVMSAFKKMILEEGAKISRQDAKATDAQLLEARLHQVIEICRFFRMPPHKIQHLANATFTNIEHQGIEFGTDTMQPWCVRWEQACSRDLIVDDEKFFAEVQMNALMRGDSPTRAAYYTSRFNIATMTRNQIRALENENPVEDDGGDSYYLNAATVMLDKSGKPITTPAAVDPTRRFGAPSPASDDAPNDDEDANATASFALLLSDAAERIVLAETRELEKRASKRAEDPEKFRTWAKGFYASHAKYVVRTLTPIARAWVAMGGDDPNVDTLADEIAGAGALRAVEGFEQRTAEDLTSYLRSAFIYRKVQRAA